ncbi:MAG: SIS domain-containing protein [Elusimicrobia bacterium]|nr:SIS domain-containing protein [Elusimicrobiota bacterium]
MQERFQESSEVLNLLSFDSQTAKTLAKIAEEITTRLNKGRRVVIFGNGGSAADAQHFAAELVGGYTNHNRKALDAIALSTNTSNLTAIGNDYAFDEIFSRQIQAHCRQGDVAIGISTSGNSKNVLLALRQAKRMGVLTVGFTGHQGGLMKKDKAIDLLFQAPSRATPRIQEAHINAIHSICELIEITLFGRGKN